MFKRSLCCYFCTRCEGKRIGNKTMPSTMPCVQVEQGMLKGVTCENGEQSYVAFKGIPYALPPLGKLRFKAPEPPKAWQGVRDASQHGPVCPQYNERLDRLEPGDEDCLYLNVYTKTLTPKTNLPVMVWIHGGGFYTGSGNSDFYGPEFFMIHDVILVTFNYRLEVLGFLCLDNDEVPGNAGLKDQVAALKWVKKNIAAFGGDPDNITIFGCSAGAAATSYHLLSKMSEGLFNKAICQSGVCLHEWSYNIHARQRAFQLGKLLGKDTNDAEELLAFLRDQPTLSLVNIKLPLIQTKYIDIADKIYFGPVIERPEINIEKFLSTPPLDLVKKGQITDVPIILGYTSGEGIEIGRHLHHTAEYLSTAGAVVPRELKLKWTDDKIKLADTTIRQKYFGEKDISNETLQQYIDLETDKLFAYNIHRFARLYARYKSKPVYLYKFTTETERNFTKRMYNMENVDGVCHADDLPYLYNITCLDVPLTEESHDIIRKFVKLWINFATTGDPTASDICEQWKPFTETQQNCFIIGNTYKCVQNEDAEKINFWDQIYEENFNETS